MSVAYLTRLCLKPAAGLPWSLCRGDVSHNLRALALLELDQSHCSATHQIQALYKLGINQEDLQDALILLGQVGWTTKGVEEQHGSLAHVHRAHPDIDATNLSLRGYIHACRVFWRPDRHTTRLARLQKQLKRLRERRGRHISGENLFFKELHSRVRCRLKGQTARPGVQQHVLKQSRTRWAQLSDQQKNRYRMMARDATHTKLAANKSEEAGLRTQIQLVSDDIAAEQKERQGLNALSACRFSEQSTQLLADYHGRTTLTQSTLQQFTDRLSIPPAALSQDELRGLEPHLHHHLLPEVPGWGRTLCSHREQFNDCVIRHGQGRQQRAWLFLCGLQRPYVAHWLPLCPITASESPASSSSCSTEDIPISLDDATPMWAHHWSYSLPASYTVEWSEMPGDDAVDALDVITKAFFVGHHRVVSDAAAVPFNVFTKHLPEKKVTRATMRLPKASDDLMQAHPWLVDVLSMPSASKPTASPHSESSDDETADPVGLQHTDEAIEAAWQDLQEKRNQLNEDEASESAHFIISIRGGAYTYKKAGVAADCVVCSGRGASAKSFCKEFGLQQMYSFAFKKYSEPAALRMASEVCKRLEYWHSLHLEFDEVTADFTEDLLATYAGHEGFQSWCDELAPGSATAVRATAIQAMRPARRAPQAMAD